MAAADGRSPTGTINTFGRVRIILVDGAMGALRWRRPCAQDGAPSHLRIGLHRQHQLVRLAVNLQHVHAGRVEQRGGPGHSARRDHTHSDPCRGSSVSGFAWSLLIMKAPDPITPAARSLAVTDAQIGRPAKA